MPCASASASCRCPSWGLGHPASRPHGPALVSGRHLVYPLRGRGTPSMMNCRHATRLMSEDLDRPLSRRERLAPRFHLMMCGGCRQFRQQFGASKPRAALSHGWGLKLADHARVRLPTGRRGRCPLRAPVKTAPETKIRRGDHDFAQKEHQRQCQAAHGGDEQPGHGQRRLQLPEGA
ncbi:hypothetical protein Thiowin_02495 [Thiorhodovibrio winogradskyi]|uniref:Putative zinc-finger domain-containing protein n=1 Tax=Thiorhodovibrio winogradskyi TaxID=77007 RepID=A0ABZ0SB02_9GAMM